MGGGPRGPRRRHGTARCVAWSKAVCGALSAGRTDEVLAALDGHAGNETARRCRACIAGNRRRMRYPLFRAGGLCIGSGVVESAGGRVVGDRLKRRGMRWSVAGADAILALRCCILNGEYGDFRARPPPAQVAA